MYECEKCVHEELCDQAGRHLWGTLSGEKECSDFKDRNKYVEVKHGRWIVDAVEVDHPFLEFESVWRDVHQCSICKEYFDVSDARNYCPNCGAKMDGDGNG